MLVQQSYLVSLHQTRGVKSLSLSLCLSVCLCKREHILYVHQQLPAREVQVPPWREPTIPLVQTLVREVVFFLSLGPWFFLWSNLGKPSLRAWTH